MKNNFQKYVPNAFYFIIKRKLKLLFITILLNEIFQSPTKINKFFFFEQKQNELNFCKNYGLLIYNYYYGKKKPIAKATNIGDYIQSLAALQFLPKECKPYLIDRDNIRFYNGTKVKLIMNSWNI